MNRAILCVDDEENILRGFRRHLRREFDLDTAVGADEALRRLDRGKQYAVIVSDKHMPGMDGIQLLARVKEQYPDTVRMMLTGVADTQTAMDAVNQGSIFRFMTKPCPPEDLKRFIEAGLEQHQMIVAERELLEETLKGSVKALIDVLALTNPVAFGRSMRIKKCVSRMIDELQLEDAWQYEIAAMLSQVGYVTVPSQTLKKVLNGQALDPREQQMVERQAEVTQHLLAKIPRLEAVAEMIGGHNQPLDPFPADPKENDPALLGSHLLKVAVDYDALTRAGAAPAAARRALEHKGTYPEPLLAALAPKTAEPAQPEEPQVRTLVLEELRNGMVLAEDVYTRDGTSVVVAKDQEISRPLRRRLKNFDLQENVQKEFKIYAR